MEAPKIPDELQRKVSDAIQELCFFIHDNVGSSQVILNIQHVSDALYRSGSTNISILGGGIKVERDPNSKPVDANNKKEVDDLVASLMAKAKAKAAEKEKKDKPEDSK